MKRSKHPQLFWLVALIAVIPVFVFAQDCPETLSGSILRSCPTCQASYSSFKDALQKKDREALIALGEKLIPQARQAKNNQLLSCLLLNTGNAYGELERYEEAKAHLRSFLAIPANTIETRSRVSAHGLLAEYLRRQGFKEKAYQEYLKALEISRNSKDTMGMAMALYQAATIRSSSENHRDALNLYQQTLELATAVREIRPAFSALGGITSSYNELGIKDSALIYSYKTFEFAKLINNPKVLGYAHLNLGDCLLQSASLDSAEYHLSKAKEYFLQNKDLWSVSSVSIHFGQLELLRKNYPLSARYYAEALATPGMEAYPERRLEIYEGLAQANQLMGHYQEAIQYLETSSLLKDSLNQKTQTAKLNELELSYQNRQQKTRIKLLEQESKIKDLYGTLYVTGILFLLLFVGGMIIAYRALQKSNGLLALKNQQIETQNKQLLRYTEDLERFTSVASHDLREPLRGISSFVSLLQRRFSSQLPEGAIEYIQFIRSATTRMTKLVEDLLALSRLEKLHDSMPTDIANSRQLLDQAIQNSNQTIHERQATIETNDDEVEWPNLRCFPSPLSQVFQNLIVNAIKFSPQPMPKVYVTYHQSQNKHVFSVRDEGIGIAPEYHDRIFSMLTRLHSRQEYEGSGIGLTTCKRIIEAHKGEIGLQSAPGEGSIFFFTLPMDTALSQPASSIPIAIPQTIKLEDSAL